MGWNPPTARYLRRTAQAQRPVLSALPGKTRVQFGHVESCRLRSLPLIGEASGWPASKGWFNGYRVGGGAGSFLPHDHAEPAF